MSDRGSFVTEYIYDGRVAVEVLARAQAFFGERRVFSWPPEGVDKGGIIGAYVTSSYAGGEIEEIERFASSLANIQMEDNGGVLRMAVLAEEGQQWISVGCVP